MDKVRKIWRGEEPLVRTFWLYGFVGFIVIGIVDNMIASAVMPFDGAGGALTFLAFYLLALVYGAFIIGAVWRSAGNYTGPRAWFYLARLWAIVGVFGIVSQVLALLGIGTQA